MKEIPLAGKYSHLKCKLDDDWAKMFEDGGIKLIHGVRGYVFSNVRKNRDDYLQRIHQIIMDGTRRGMVIDHINNDKLDNRRENLRFCSQKSNSNNKNSFLSRINKNKFNAIGLTIRESGKFCVRLRSNGEVIYYKQFNCLEEAKLVAEFNHEIRDL